MNRAVVTLITCAVLFSAGLASSQQSRPRAPDEIRAWLQYHVGNWVMEGTLGNEAFRGESSIRWASGKHCIVGGYSASMFGVPTRATFLTGWDPSTDEILEHGFFVNGLAYTMRYKVASATVLEGELSGCAPGATTSAKLRLEKKGPDQFVLSVTDRSLGDRRIPDMVLRYSREKPPGQPGEGRSEPADP